MQFIQNWRSSVVCFRHLRPYVILNIRCTYFLVNFRLSVDARSYEIYRTYVHIHTYIHEYTYLSVAWPSRSLGDWKYLLRYLGYEWNTILASCWRGAKTTGSVEIFVKFSRRSMSHRVIEEARSALSEKTFFSPRVCCSFSFLSNDRDWMISNWKWKKVSNLLASSSVQSAPSKHLRSSSLPPPRWTWTNFRRELYLGIHMYS